MDSTSGAKRSEWYEKLYIPKSVYPKMMGWKRAPENSIGSSSPSSGPVAQLGEHLTQSPEWIGVCPSLRCKEVVGSNPTGPIVGVGGSSVMISPVQPLGATSGLHMRDVFSFLMAIYPGDNGRDLRDGWEYRRFESPPTNPIME